MEIQRYFRSLTKHGSKLDFLPNLVDNGVKAAT